MFKSTISSCIKKKLFVLFYSIIFYYTLLNSYHICLPAFHFILLCPTLLFSTELSCCDLLQNFVKSDKYTLSKISLKSQSQHSIRTWTFKSGWRKISLTYSER